MSIELALLVLFFPILALAAFGLLAAVILFWGLAFGLMLDGVKQARRSVRSSAKKAP